MINNSEVFNRLEKKSISIKMEETLMKNVRNQNSFTKLSLENSGFFSIREGIYLK